MTDSSGAEAHAAELTGRIIDDFGGIRPMATKLSVPVTTVQGWKKRGIIPQARHGEILAAAGREAIALDAAELAATDFSQPGPAGRTDSRPPDPRPSDATLTISPPASGPVVVRRGGAAAYSALIISLLVGIGVVGAGFAAWRFYLQPLQTKVAALESRLRDGAHIDAAPAAPQSPATQSLAAASPEGQGDAAARLAALERQLGELKAGAAQGEQLAKSLSDLQVAAGGRELLAQSIRDIQSSTAAAQGEVERLAAQVSAFGGRLDHVDALLADRRQVALRAEATILAVGQLRAALAESRPFAKELATVRALGGEDAAMVAALDQLQPYADTGIPSAEDLTRSFAHLAPAIVRSAVIGDGQSWWWQALYHVGTVISIRHIGADTPGDAADAVVARAEAKLDEGDLPGAIAALRALSGLPAETAAPWIQDAGHRSAADAAEGELTRLAIARVATGGGGGAVTPNPSAPVSAPVGK